jgi:hypothetical protein
MRACPFAGVRGAVPLADVGNGSRLDGFQGGVSALRPSRWLVEVVVLAVFAFLAVSAISGWRSADYKNSGLPEALSLAVGPRPAGGYLTLTAAALNISQPFRNDLGYNVRYVGAGQDSAGPFVVSVHPIDSSTWAAVARGPDGLCYGTLVSNPTPDNFRQFYATFPAGIPCKGEIATARTVTSTQYPEMP